MSNATTFKYGSTYQRIFTITIDGQTHSLADTDKIELIREKVMGTEFDRISTEGVAPNNRLEIVDVPTGKVKLLVNADYWAPYVEKYYYYVRETTNGGQVIDYPLVGRFSFVVGY